MKRKRAAETEEVKPAAAPAKRQRRPAVASTNGNAVQVADAAGALEFITSRSNGSNDPPAYSRVGVVGGSPLLA